MQVKYRSQTSSRSGLTLRKIYSTPPPYSSQILRVNLLVLAMKQLTEALNPSLGRDDFRPTYHVCLLLYIEPG